MSPLLTRRSFLAASALPWAGNLFGDREDTSANPAPALEKLGAVAIAEAKRQGANYCDIRINAYRDQYCGYRLSPQRGGSKVDEVPSVNDSRSSGFGVR